MSNQAGPLAADHWHLGEIWVDGKWRSFDEIASLEKPRQLAEYQTLRGENSLAEYRHRELARWCKSHKLADQEQAHWYGVLLTSPDNAEARSALGHQMIEGRWYTQQDLKMADDTSRRVEAEWRKWMPILRAWSSLVSSELGRMGA